MDKLTHHQIARRNVFKNSGMRHKKCIILIISRSRPARLIFSHISRALQIIMQPKTSEKREIKPQPRSRDSIKLKESSKSPWPAGCGALYESSKPQTELELKIQTYTKASPLTPHPHNVHKQLNNYTKNYVLLIFNLDVPVEATAADRDESIIDIFFSCSFSQFRKKMMIVCCGFFPRWASSRN